MSVFRNALSNVYLTGSSGFIGKSIVKLLEKDARVDCVYCPIRRRGNRSGEDRFQELFSDCAKTVYIDPSEPLPKDVTKVILNAYSVKFDTPVDKILKANVEPMLDILE